MTSLGTEFVGRLPPGAAGDLKRSLRDYRQVARHENIKGVKILPGRGCAVAEAQAGTVYSIEQIPGLPLTGCDRAPCCGCCYVAVVE
jgi:hypothetical protein